MVDQLPVGVFAVSADTSEALESTSNDTGAPTSVQCMERPLGTKLDSSSKCHTCQRTRQHGLTQQPYLFGSAKLPEGLHVEEPTDRSECHTSHESAEQTAYE